MEMRRVTEEAKLIEDYPKQPWASLHLSRRAK
jgi:hypothetical protein